MSRRTMNLDDTLKERGSVHGDFAVNSRIIQKFKHIIETSPTYAILTPVQREALDMIAHKLGRILTGDPNHPDHWHDIQGYARLVEKELEQ